MRALIAIALVALVSGIAGAGYDPNFDPKKLENQGTVLDVLAELGACVADGRLNHAENVQEGFENTPKTFLRIFSGANLGKQLLKIADPE